jgi:transcriptional regulator with XRE-family HTH domain
MTADQFGPRLRAEREQQGISLEAMGEATKVSVDLWEAMERNDFSRWPAGVFARAFIRDYARTIGLDGDAVVNDFCRFFPVGDRRVVRIVRAQAELIGHAHQADPAELLPAGRERRRPRAPRPPEPAPIVYRPRLLAAAVDGINVLGLTVVAATVFGTSLLAAAGVVAPVYFTAGTIAAGASPGALLLRALRHRAPSLFASRRPVSA